MATKVLALDQEGNLTYCESRPENIGKGRCNHIAHQGEDESVEDFMERAERIIEDIKSKNQELVENSSEITQDKINDYANQIDNIAGQKITVDNFEEVISKLTPAQIAAIAKIGFDAAPEFSLPIKEENYQDEQIKTQLYFSGLASAGIGGNQASIIQMFKKVGNTNMLHGETVDVKHSYKEGLTNEEYFARQFVSRDSMINKGIETAKPGYAILDTQRLIVYRK